MYSFNAAGEFVDVELVDILVIPSPLLVFELLMPSGPL